MNSHSDSMAAQSGASVAPPRGRLKLLALAALFLGPVALAFVLYYGGFGERVAGGDVSHGELVLPTEPLPSLADLPVLASGRIATPEPLRRYWNIVQVTGDGCASACRQALADSARVRSLLVKERDRVGRVLLVTGAALPDLEDLTRSHPDLAVIDGRSLRDEGEVLSRLAWTGTEGQATITDPLTNVVLRFGAEDDRMGMFHDLKRLLKLSRIG